MKKILIALTVLISLSASAITRSEAIDFIYSTLSLPDSADYSRAFYEKNIDLSFKAREEMPWGKSIPDREFMHFVLPIRVNNENLDMSREVFYNELKDRVKSLSMADAILEVNHWCHEHVTYRPSDGRTSSPLSTLSQAIGRCGEESTFTVAALRSVGIPARQIYTPRWAHTDDNHAWVEAWADGKWYFIGACEPEPILNLAWFNAPASRGLLMSTNVAGKYNGPEEVLLAEPLTTRINVTDNYAPTGIINVAVTNLDGSPAIGANVGFCIYNYSEFYPAVTKITDANGFASLRCGLGEMLVWASANNKFGFAKAYPDNNNRVTIKLDMDENSAKSFDLDVIPPKAGAALPIVSKQQRSENDRRMQYEDSIRGAYTASFADKIYTDKLAKELNLNCNDLSKVLIESRGNFKNIENCLRKLGKHRQKGLDLLLNVTEKDRRDISVEVIKNHVINTIPMNRIANNVSAEIYNKYILSPRIENEGLRPWRKSLASQLSKAGLSNDALKLANWIEQNIALDNASNPQNLRMSPEAVLKVKRANSLSRYIFFVAAARSLGIPARIDPVTGDAQYYDYNGKWQTVRFAATADNSTKSAVKTGSLSLTFTPSKFVIDPKYYSQFSLCRITNGVPRQLEFEEDGTVSSIFAKPVELEIGQYMLVSGQRLADGGVLTHNDIFTIAEGENVTKELIFRKDDSALSVIGSLNAENIYHDIALNADKSIISTTGRGYYVLALLKPNHEPSAHALNDMRAVAKELGETGVKFMMLFDDADAASRFNMAAFSGMPEGTVFGIDNNGATRNELIKSLHLENADYPIIVVADTFNRVVWVSTGYTIGTGTKLLQTLARLQN